MSKEVLAVNNGRILGPVAYRADYIDDDWAILRYREQSEVTLWKRVPDGMSEQTYFIDGRFYRYGYNFRRELPRWSFTTLAEALAAIGLNQVQHFI